MKSLHEILRRAARLLLTLPAMALLAGCEVIDYHPYDTRFSGATDINAANVRRIETSCAGRRSLRFAVISDTQRWYDETRAAVDAINAAGVDFVIHCGDVSDFGATREMVWMRDELQRLRMPYVVLLGNHDCVGTGLTVFSRMFGPPDFAFTAGFVRFVCLNTNALEFDYSVPVPDFGFIRTQRDAVPEGVERTVVAMHAAPRSEQFNNNVAEHFHAELRRFPGLAFCLCGHGHATLAMDLFDDGVLYYECGAAKTRQYLLFTMNENETTYEVVSY